MRTTQDDWGQVSAGERIERGKPTPRTSMVVYRARDPNTVKSASPRLKGPVRT